MELKEFIKTALADITNAVCELQTELSNGAIINPCLGKTAPASGGAKPLERPTCENGDTGLCIQNPQATQKQ